MKISFQESLASLNIHESPFLQFFKHGTLSVELYKPVEVDLQQPHEQDEVYIVMAGKGYFLLADEVRPFEAGDFLFVPAGIAHKFLDFTEDFVTWVVFYGVKGGESVRNR